MHALRKLIENMLFLSPVMKQRLIESLHCLSAKRVKEIYLRFFDLQKLEKKFMVGFFERHPDIAKQVVSEAKRIKKSVVSDVESVERQEELEKINRIFE